MANWLRGLSWHAKTFTDPMSGKVTLIVSAFAAGFGEIIRDATYASQKYPCSISGVGINLAQKLKRRYARKSYEVDYLSKFNALQN